MPHNTELLKMLWTLGEVGRFASADGSEVEIRKYGEYDGDSGRFNGAEVAIDGTVFKGEVVVGYEAPAAGYDNAILHAVAKQEGFILRLDGSPVTQIVVKTDPVAAVAYETLKEGCTGYGCGRHIAALPSHERVALFTRLMTDRLARKYSDIHAIYKNCEQNWNETMYVMLMRTMGDSKNKDAFTELARRISYKSILRERESIVYVEAMLLGASGLLNLYGDDPYIRELRSSFEYLRSKYSITPMNAGSWVISHNNPNNHPVIRIVQMASFLTSKDFLFNNLMRCRTVEDIQTLFRAEASQYWSTHYVPSQRSYDLPKRIGHFKANILGINLTVPMMFAYGDYMKDDELKLRSIELLEKITCESNRIVDSWRAGGVVMESAFDSQAILQLNNEYCLKALCWQCPIGKRVIRKTINKSNSI